mgnify:CR=1 FL=1
MYVNEAFSVYVDKGEKTLKQIKNKDSQKGKINTKMHMTQMEMTKRLGVSQGEFSELLRGDAPLSMSFVSRFCQHLQLITSLIYS